MFVYRVLVISIANDHAVDDDGSRVCKIPGPRAQVVCPRHLTVDDTKLACIRQGRGPSRIAHHLNIGILFVEALVENGCVDTKTCILVNLHVHIVNICSRSRTQQFQTWWVYASRLISDFRESREIDSQKVVNVTCAVQSNLPRARPIAFRNLPLEEV